MSSKSTPPKVFISYSHDSGLHIERVRKLSARLRRDGIDCNIDQYELSPPEGWLAWTDKQVEDADFVLMVFSLQYKRSFLASGQVKMSMAAPWEGAIITQTQFDRLRKKDRVIVVVFNPDEATSLPGMLRDTSTYNIIGNLQDYQQLYYNLTKAELGILKALPVGESVQSFLRIKKARNVQFKRYCNLPYKPYNKFIGREAEIANLLTRISPDYRAYISVVMGIGGVGKTALVLEVAHRCWQAKKKPERDPSIPIFDAIIFTSSKATDLINTRMIERPEKEALLTDVFRVIADVLEEPTITQVLPEQQIAKVYESLKKQSTLLIVDNMETLSEEERKKMLSFLNNVPTSTQVIITTRDFLGFDDIYIQSLNEQEGYELLDRQAKLKKITIDDEWKKKIHQRFSGIPIALIYAVGQKVVGYDFSDNVDSNVTDISTLGRFCFDSSVSPLKGTAAYQLLLAMTFFEDSPCRDALIKVAGLVEGDPVAIHAVAKIQQLSLVIENSGRYGILALTREYALLELSKNENTEFRKLARKRWYEWYLEFTTQYGGDDWEGWRARYDRLDDEWKNIESVLNWYANREQWWEVLQLWQNVDNYADLSGYWQYRRYWWALLGNYFGSAETQVKALSEKGFTLTLMGTEHYDTADDYLNRAWDLCQDNVDNFIRATVANHQAVLAKVRGNYPLAHEKLDIEENLLRKCPSGREREIKKYRTRNLFYRAETNLMQGNLDSAKEELERTLEWSKEIKWQRFRNYAKNILADIHIQENNLEAAEPLLKAGLLTATQARETRRVALYQASYARFYYKQAQKAQNDGLEEESHKHINDAHINATKALEVFTRELMIAEKDDIIKLIGSIEEQQAITTNLNSSVSIA